LPEVPELLRRLGSRINATFAFLAIVDRAALAGYAQSPRFGSAGFIAPMVLDAPMDGDAFRAWWEQMLAPPLRPGHLVIMDNLAAHKVAGVRPSLILDSM
jgi:hypothetical protein